METGLRYVMSLWFTCDTDREFSTFMDGKIHNTFTSGASDGSEGGLGGVPADEL